MANSRPANNDKIEINQTYGYALLSLLLIGVIPWRRDVYYTGQFDWVVNGKIALLVFTLILAAWIKGISARNAVPTNRVPAAAFLLVMLYLGISIIGALLSGDFGPSVALAMRVAAIGIVVVAVVEGYKPLTVIEMLSRVMAGGVFLVCTTGTFSEPLYRGRLTGTFPPIAPNQIAFLAAVPLVYLVWRSVNFRPTPARTMAVVALGAITVLTQSRTTTGLLFVVLVILMLCGSRSGHRRVLIVSAGLAVMLVLVTVTNIIQSYASRGGAGIAPGARTIAWNAVLNASRTTEETLFGNGLVAKQVAVEGQYWESQILDSSWFSSFVQAGAVGLVVAIGLVFYGAANATRIIRPEKDLWLALFVLVIGRSVFESGLIDASSSFVVFMIVSLGAATTNAQALWDSGGDGAVRIRSRALGRSHTAASKRGTRRNATLRD